ncbi:MAG TPA: hypothetical protein ENI61_04170 [Ignavibacteria bacterium]|nr:hypothetical protein [Ignavibacteria bacterium]
MNKIVSYIQGRSPANANNVSQYIYTSQLYPSPKTTIGNGIPINMTGVVNFVSNPAQLQINLYKQASYPLAGDGVKYNKSLNFNNGTLKK